MPVLNAMTVDVEEHFQVSGFEGCVPRDDWNRLDSRVSASTERLLELFADAHVRATFFVLGWVAERYPGLVRQIARAGHEVASHGHEHRLVYRMTPAEFRSDLRRARSVLERTAQMPVLGYRAPSYSIVKDSLWALDVLIEEGYLFDASIYPIRHDRYGIPGWDRHIHQIRRTGGTLWELPGATFRRLGTNFPVGGGGYFRLLPYGWTQAGLRDVNGREKQPTVFYVHPWEIDPEQPRLRQWSLASFRHYRNLSVTEGRLRRLLRDFAFGTVGEVLQSICALPAATAAQGASGLVGQTYSAKSGDLVQPLG